VNNNLDFAPGLVSFPAYKLREIILGAKMDPVFEKKAIDYAINNFPHAEIKKAFLSPVKYKLEFKNVSVVPEKC
ncbi:MAG: hypothetical protein JRC87_12100, partial [Deltaproteobacteria bacterium]|nr:hypothetical protein [Deltaproteobacteria bacterium]